ncbi:MAG TPA: CdaR family protein [Vicinamibacteria bacterium]|nr:CdaR family protein [Vicinamibacteria bacterium]
MRALLDNFPLKLASLGLACLLWWVIAGEKTSEMGISAPLELQNFPLDLEVTGDPVDRVEVRLRASPGIIQSIGPTDVSAQVDLAGLGEGEHIIHLTEGAIRMPFGVKVVKISPSILTVHLERTLQKNVPVRPRLVGRPAPGYEVAEVASEPSEMRIAGPRSRVEGVENVFTEPLSIDGAQSPVIGVLNMGLEDPLLRILGSPRVRATVQIREVQDERAVDGVEVEVKGRGSVRPDSVRVVLTGPESLLRSLTPDAVSAQADLTGARPGQEVPVTVELAPGHAGLSVKEVTPATVDVQPPRSQRKR